MKTGCLSNLLLKPRIQGVRNTYPYSAGWPAPKYVHTQERLAKRIRRDWYYKKRLEMWEFRTWFLQMENTKKAVDLLKLLNGEPDYRREE